MATRSSDNLVSRGKLPRAGRFQEALNSRAISDRDLVLRTSKQEH
jgi:hypothetical protein